MAVPRLSIRRSGQPVGGELGTALAWMTGMILVSAAAANLIYLRMSR